MDKKEVYAYTLVEAFARVNADASLLPEVTGVVPDILSKSPALMKQFTEMVKTLETEGPEEAREQISGQKPQLAFTYGWMIGILIGFHLLPEKGVSA